jgi:peptidoglycan/xylan/chitin deacetylase (PgdA/CDA1 family)
MGKIFITTSWDDGHKLDIKLSELLTKYGLAGTFYIAKDFEGRLKDEDIMEISKNHEIGAHTITHPNLLKISEDEARKEITESKQWLEALLGNKIEMFCYPFGRFDNNIAGLVEKAGFLGARTVEKFLYKLPKNLFSMGTTIQIYPFPFRKKNENNFFWRHLLDPFLQDHSSIKRNFRIPISAFRNWSSMSKAIFDSVLQKGDYFHIWGHSWEIEKYGMWSDLENFLKYISHREDCVYLTNSDLLKKIKNVI